MRIFLSEIKEIESDLHFSGDEHEWLQATVTQFDERTESDGLAGLHPHAPKALPRKVTADFTVSEVDRVVVLNGSISTHIQLLCSRCANAFDHDISPRFTSLFSQDPSMAGIPLAKDRSGRPRHVTLGTAHSSHVPSDQNLDITYLTEEFIDVKDLVAEQIQLQVPFKPLCAEDCKGLCANCGSDLNRGRCACNRIAQESPFAALRNVKLSSR